MAKFLTSIYEKTRNWLLKKPALSRSPYQPLGATLQRFTLEQLPPFTLLQADIMLMDPHLVFGLMIRNGALQQAEVEWHGNSEMVKFVSEQWDRLWHDYGGSLLRSKRYGWMPFEVCYEEIKSGPFRGMLGINELRDFHPRDGRLMVKGGDKYGVKFNRLTRATGVVLPHPASLWCTYDSQFGNHYGRSILNNAYVPFEEKWRDHGGKDVLRVRMMKDGYSGEIIWAPDQKMSIPDPVTGELKQFHVMDVFRRALETKLAGGTTVFPYLKDSNGNELVKYEPPHDNGRPDGILEWNERLDREIWEGLGVVKEVAEASETGSGYSGRSIAMTTFMGLVTDEFKWILNDVLHDVLIPLAHINFGRDPDIDGRVKPLVETYADDVGGTQVGGGALGGPASGQGQQLQPQPQQNNQPPQPQQFAEDGTQWITIGGHEEGDKKHVGGFPVQIDKDGIIQAGGPKSLRGKHVSEVKDHFDSERENKSGKEESEDARQAPKDNPDMPAEKKEENSVKKFKFAQLPEEIARAAHRGTSFVPEKRGREEVENFKQVLESDYERLFQLADTDEKKRLLDDAFERYQEGYLSKAITHLQAKSRVASSMITGPANFPTARNQKRLDVEHKRMQDVADFRKKAISSIERKLTPEKGPIKSGDSDAVERLTEKVAKLERLQEQMKSANKIVRAKPKNERTPEKELKLRELGFNDEQIGQVFSPDAFGQVGFASYRITNNNAEIKRNKDRLAVLKRNKDRPETSKAGNGIKLEDSPADNRVRLFFDGKPPADVRQKLKSSGFRWSPKIGAWQAYRNNRSLSVANGMIAGETTQFREDDLNPKGADGADDALRPFLDPASKWIRKTIGEIMEDITAEVGDNVSDPTLSDRINEIIGRLRERVRKGMSESMVAAGLQGYYSVGMDVAEIVPPSVIPSSSDIGPPEEPPTSPAAGSPGEGPEIRFPVYDKMVEDLAASPVFSDTDYRVVAQQAQEGAFAITADLEDSTVADIRDALAENLRQSPNAEKFVEDVREILTNKNGLSENHLHTVFRTNLSSSLAKSMNDALSNPLVGDYFPYRSYYATSDRAVRPEHKAMETNGLDGTNIYNADDPVWKKFQPPFDYGCRCSWSATSVTQAARRGVREAQEWLERAKAMAKEKGGRASEYYTETRPTTFQFVPMPPFEPSPEFRRDVTE